MTGIEASTLYGTLNLLLLKTLEDEALHGLEIQRRIDRLTGSSLQIDEGALYPALRRLERDGLLESEWGISEARRRARFYRLTARGQKRLAREQAGWLDYVKAVARVLKVSPEQQG
ncbi:MAG: PadR family transcriptional regulator [Gemmatimonadota bacterium]